MNKRLSLVAVTLIASLASLATACGGPTDPVDDTDTGTDADTGSGADAGDTGDASDDTDTDGGSDTDSDSDAGIDTDDGGTDVIDDTSDTTDAADGSGAGPIDRVPLEPERIVCEERPALTGATCAVTPGGDRTLITGDVLTDTAIYVGGEVLVGSSGQIECVGCDCPFTDLEPAPTLLDCPGAAVSAGLINGHDHITYTYDAPGDWGDERFEHRHDWREGVRGHNDIRYGSQTSDPDLIGWGELRQVMLGTTSLIGSGGADGWLRNLDRAVAQHEGLNQDPVDYSTFPLGDLAGTLRTADCSYPEIESTSVLDVDCYLPHISEGIDLEAQNEFLCLTSTDRGGVDLVEDNTAIVHAIGLDAIDAVEVATNGASVIWSPRSNISLYGNTAQVTLLNIVGVNIGIGTDWTPSGSVGMPRELACAAYLNDVHYGGYFSDFELWRMATIGNAIALAVDDATGALRPGLAGDIAIFDVREAANPYRGIFEATADDVALVLRGGDALYGDTDLVEALDTTDGCASIGDVCGIPKGACVEREVGQTFEALAAANATSYGLFFCDTPAGEPTCMPIRPGEYTGVTDTDGDGDGIADEVDNCVAIFNPIRPMDGGIQSDLDADGEGDVCDPCPLEADSTTCAPADPNDRDGDGVPVGTDNCGRVANPDQADQDGDLVGDACDACPLDANPGGAACPASIHAVRRGEVAVGAAVRISGVVTGVGADIFYLQVEEADYTADDALEFSGLAVYVGAAGYDSLGTPVVGQRVTLDGTVGAFAGEIQLTRPANLTVLGAGVVPTPVELTDAEANGGARAAALEGVLVTVADTEVTEHIAASLDFTVGTLRVGSRLFVRATRPFVGDRVDVTGVLRVQGTTWQVEPRTADDLVVTYAGPPRLVSFGPERSFVLLGSVEALTFPEPLTVALDRPAPVDIVIEVESSDPTVIADFGLLIPEGETAAIVTVTAVDPGTGSGVYDVELLAFMDDPSMGITAAVTAFNAAAPRTLVSLGPDPLDISFGGTGTMTVSLDIPAGPGGVTVALDVSDSGLITLPASVVVPEGEFSASFNVLGGSVEGPVEVTATLELTTLAATVNVVAVGPLRAPAAAGELVITEIMARSASGSGDRGEWFELYNTTRSPLELNGCTLFDNGSHTISRSVIIDPGAYAVFALSGVAADNGGIPVVTHIYTTLALNNGGETLGVRCGDLVIDQLDYSSTTIALAASAQLNVVPPDAVANDTATNWCVSGVAVTYGDATRRGTPGAATRCE